jgi:glutathione S-transferase
LKLLALLTPPDLALKVGSDLVPKQTDVEAYARFEQACSIEMANFDPAASGLAHELVFSKLYGQEPNQERVKEYKDTLAKRLAGYERVLSKHKYVAGDKLTVADLYHLP